MTASVRIPASAPERHAVAVDAATADQWVSLGPATVTRGRAPKLPRVAGRVRALAVSPGGQRVYAGTALGGVWYSGDGGGTWAALDFYTSAADATGALQHSDALTVGAIGVMWDAANTADTDIVFVGAGEHPGIGSDDPAPTIQAVGIRSAKGPAATVMPVAIAPPAVVGAAAASPWLVESPNLSGLAVQQFATDLVTPGVMWAATNSGLYRRTPPVAAVAPGPGVAGIAAVPAQWVKVVTPFGDVEVSAVVAVAGVVAAEAQRLYIATAGGRVAWSNDGVAFTEIVLPAFAEAVVPASVQITRMRLTVANGPANPVVYAFAAGPRLWRIDVVAPALVAGAPTELGISDLKGREPFGLAIAAHPTNDAAHQDMIMLGGHTFSAAGAPRQAALFVTKPQNAAGAWSIAAAAPVDGTPAEWIGGGMPPGVHAIVLVTVGAVTHLWIGGDGGVFRSTTGGARGSFKERNTGLGAIEATSFAQAATSETTMLVSTRSSGVLRRRGPATWTVIDDADMGRVGAVAIDPANARRMYVQGQGPAWRESKDGGNLFSDLQFRTIMAAGDNPATTTEKTAENTASAPISRMALLNIPDDPRGTIKALGTNRVWYTDDALLRAAKKAAADTGSVLTGWVTLPNETDPYAAAAPAVGQDHLDSAVLACAWGSPDRLYALTKTSVYLFDRAAGAGWSPFERLYDDVAVTEAKKKKNAPPAPPPTPQGLPFISLAVRQPASGKGTLYLGTGGPGDKTHVWYFDGAGKWISTGFMRDTPVYAIVVDPGADTVVYAATRSGVFKGTGNFAVAGAPTWQWDQYSLGLPEAPCIDLAVYAPAGEKRRLLRAALAGRGVWEVALPSVDAGVVPVQQAPEVYLRAHVFDSRRVEVPAGGARNPVSVAREQVRLDASPDIRVRRRPAASLPEPVATQPFGTALYNKFAINADSDAYDIWLTHSALRAAGEDIDPDAVWSAATDTMRNHQAGILLPAVPAPTPAQIWNALLANNRLGVDRDMDAADLATYVRDEPDRWPKGARTSCVSTNLVSVHVAVHSRHWRPIAENTIRVTLLKTPYGVSGRSARGSLANVAALPAGWAADVSAGNPLGAGAWEYADPANPRHTLTTLLDPNNPGTVRFDVDLAGGNWDKPGWLLLAVVIAGVDPLATAETNVATLVRTDHHVAARSVRNAAVLTEPLTRYAGMDVGSYPAIGLMDSAWAKSNMYFTGMYLESPRPVISDAATGTTHATNREVGRIRIGGKKKDVTTAAIGWAVGLGITGPGIPAGTTIAAIGADGTSLTLSQDATAYASGAAVTVAGAATPAGTADIYMKTVVSSLPVDIRTLNWAAGKPVGGDGIPAGTTIVAFAAAGTWIEMSKAATATAEVQVFTIAGNITAASANVTNLSENVTDRGWRAGMSIQGDGIPAGTDIQAIAANGLSLTLSANANAAPATTKAGVALKVGELVIAPKPLNGHARYAGLYTRADEPWMRGWRDLHETWGIAPLYWGQQPPNNEAGPTDLGTVTPARRHPPDMGLENARDAVSKLIRTGVPFGAAVYLDWEKGNPLPADGLAYCTRFFRVLQEFGFRAAVYCHEGPTQALADGTPGLIVWNVSAIGGTTAQQPGDISVQDSRFVLRLPSLVGRGLLRQWRFDSGFPLPPPLAATPNPLPGFPNIDIDVGIVADPAFPERAYIPGEVRGGHVALAPNGDDHTVIFGMQLADPKVVEWIGAGPTSAYHERFDVEWPYWWNPFSPVSAVRVPPPGNPPAAGAPATHVLFVAGILKSPRDVQARGDWSIATARHRIGEPWAYEMVPSNGVTIDPLPGVVATTRSDRSIDVFAVDDQSGAIVVSRWDPAAAAPNAYAWTSLAPLAPAAAATGEVRRTTRPAAVSRAAGVADLFWVRPTVDAGVAINAATAVAPIAVTTAANHGFSTGDPVMISEMQGNIAANGIFNVTVTSATTFTLDDSRGSSPRTGGGLATAIDGRVYTSASTALHPTEWSAPARIGGANVRVHPFANLVAVSAGTTRIDVLFIGRADGTLEWSLYDIVWTQGAGWGAASVLAGSIVLAPNIRVDPLVPIAACSRSAASVDAFVAGTNGLVYVTTLNTGTGAWSAFQAITGATHVTCLEAAARVGANGGMVVATDRAGNVLTSTAGGAVNYRPFAATNLSA